MKDINLPNKLTILRIILVPIFIILLSLSYYLEIDYLKYIALAIFIIAAITDYIDGYISRKYNLVTKFGKIMDPVADKLLVSSGLIMLTAVGTVPALVTVLVIFRDLFVNGLRMIAVDTKDVSADIAGKIKTVFQFLVIILGILDVSRELNGGFLGFLHNSGHMISTFSLFINILFSISIIAVVISTVLTLITYTQKYMKNVKLK